MAKGRYLGLILAKVFLVHHEKIRLERCPLECRLFYYRRYPDDMFVLFNSAEHLKRFQSYLNSCHVSISFPKEKKKDDKMFFFDINLVRQQGKFTTFAYRKPT